MPSKTRPDAFPPEAPAHAAPADLALFVHVAELGSFSAVARAVDRLEALYRVRLLRRSTHGLSLTPEGGTLLQHARQVLAALGDLADELSARRERASGVVRLAVSPALAQCFVVPALPALAARHPTCASSCMPTTASSIWRPKASMLRCAPTICATRGWWRAGSGASGASSARRLRCWRGWARRRRRPIWRAFRWSRT
ncbi:hypothetical protein X805_03190 [Sphaerotilus natans subsp. natans DSM 6575]|uniref:HTH lysR-type domain-containing protein n=1 Tax=Sphaerotilus natans subsp. natans DSM 6575 TaxID=1286631 RepID=A0A059KRP9_9BURK|nr:hypothetical protein X805_03190 [Sphaerotilus natans subsp. natans DSM 6575]